jgi:hypothetical protein
MDSRKWRFKGNDSDDGGSTTDSDASSRDDVCSGSVSLCSYGDDDESSDASTSSSVTDSDSGSETDDSSASDTDDSSSLASDESASDEVAAMIGDMLAMLQSKDAPTPPAPALFGGISVRTMPLE